MLWFTDRDGLVSDWWKQIEKGDPLRGQDLADTEATQAAYAAIEEIEGDYRRVREAHITLCGLKPARKERYDRMLFAAMAELEQEVMDLKLPRVYRTVDADAAETARIPEARNQGREMAGKD